MTGKLKTGPRQPINQAVTLFAKLPTVNKRNLIRLWPLLLIALVVLCDPVLANKFETIGGGVAGNS